MTYSSRVLLLPLRPLAVSNSPTKVFQTRASSSRSSQEWSAIYRRSPFLPSSFLFLGQRRRATQQNIDMEPWLNKGSQFNMLHQIWFIQVSSKWLLRYPRFLSNPAYVGGDSYGGKLVPLVAKEIVQGNELGQLDQPALPVIKLKGYLVGNGVTAVRADVNSQVPRAHVLGIISDELFERLVKSCEGKDYVQPLNARCAANMKIYNQFISEINIQNVLAPKCDGSMTPERRRAMVEGKINTEIMLDPPKSSDNPCSEDLSHLASLWGNNPLVWKALHIKEGTLENWQFCNEDLNKKYIYSVESVVPCHFYLATKGYRSLFYSGDHDLKIPFTRTMEWIRSLNFSVIQGWRSWHFGGQVAGYTVLFSNNLTFATVLGGSHTPPANKPMQSFSMFERWMSHELL